MMLTISIVGFGSRGQMFAKKIKAEGSAKLVAIAEPVEQCRNVGEKHNVPEEMRFSNADDFFAQGKISDAVFICTQDAQHKDMAIRAMELGYDMILEKPAATNLEDCLAIRDTANRLGRKVMLTHGMRYMPFYQHIKKLIVEGVLGEIVSINQTENIAYWHFSLSYVRGPWRKMADSSATIMAKCCHDIDIINWLIPSKCVAVSSFGNLYHFRPEQAPKGSADWCVDCDPETREKCLYNSYKVYPERINAGVVGGTARLKGRDIFEVIDNKEDVIARCVYHGENDAIDNQVVNMVFENGATAHLTMNAFSERCYREVHIHGTKGHIWGDADEGILHLQVFGQPKQDIDVNSLVEVDLHDGHGGGDYFMYLDFLDYMRNDGPSLTRTSINDSIEGHTIGFLAEKSRQENGAVQLVNF